MKMLVWACVAVLVGAATLVGAAVLQPGAAEHSLMKQPAPAAFQPITPTASGVRATLPPLATKTPLPPTATPTLPPTATPTLTPTAEAPHAYVFPVRAEWMDYGPYHHDYPAADIFCPIGSEFLATTSGVVDFVSPVDQWDPATNHPEHRGGMSVAIIGDDGWRYYGSHLSGVAEGIEPGARVEAGQVLGYTGKSGNARSTPPHLHYGISHPTTPDDWKTRRGEIAPYNYLKAWERGEWVTPAP